MTQTQDALLDYAYDVLDTHEYGSNEYRLADFYINREASLSAPQAAGWQPIETCKPFDGLVAYIGFDDGFYSLARYCDFTDDKGRVQFWSLSDYHVPDIYKTYGNRWEPDKWFAVPSLIPAPVPRLGEQDAPTVEAVTELPDGWDLYCLGRASQGEYWLEVREIKSGKLARDLGMSLVYSDTIEGAFKSATKMIEAALQNAAK